jgi:maltose alpha-D-glucosyltransferase/alpha-amylase
VPSYKLSVQTCSKIPDWLSSAIIYEVYPQSFHDSNADGIGDLPGIIQKLDYIKSLGCNTIWLNPCFESPFCDAGYDISDFYKVAPRYGTARDLCELFRQAKERNMRVVLDLVAGHTSTEHPWFKASCQREPNKYSNWYIWTSNVWETAPAPLQQVNGFCERDGNYVTNFFHFQPALNYGFANPDPKRPWQLPVDHPDVLAVKEEIIKIMSFWLEKGADGFRVDMASTLIKLDSDNSATIGFWQGIRERFGKTYPEAVLIAEWSTPRAAIDAGFHVDFLIHFGSRAYTPLFRAHTTNDIAAPSGASFFHRDGAGDIMEFLNEYLFHYRATKGRGYISLPTGNHDISRIRGSRSDEELKIVYTFLFTMPGLPCIYQGDEIGKRNIDG